MSDGSDEVLTRGPCPDCHSSNNLVTYRDGHQFCYSPGCGLKGKSTMQATEVAPQSKPRGDQVPCKREFLHTFWRRGALMHEVSTKNRVDT